MKTNTGQKATNDKEMQLIIGSLLRWGVLLSMFVVIWGGVIYLSRHGHSIPNYTVFTGAKNFTNTFSGIWDGFLHNRGRAIIQLGIVLLIATPIARVLFSAIGFAAEKDYLYVVITLIVLAIILISMADGFGG